MRHRSLQAVWTGMLLLLAADRARAATAHVSYLAGRSAYVDVGQVEGLALGDTLRVTRAGRDVARLRVSFLSLHRAACDTLWTRAPLAIGDDVVFRPGLASTVPGPAADTTVTAVARADSIRREAVLPAPRARAALRSTRTRGRIGASWLSVVTDGVGQFQQPALDLRLDDRDRMGGHVDAALDVRGRRTVTVGPAGSELEQLSRVYRASMTLRSEDGRERLTLGRQSSPTLASISLFDGALAEVTGERHAAGLFAGTQPDPLRYRWSGDIVEGGGFLEWHAPPRAPARWAASVGGVTSRAGGELNRDFAFAQGWWFSRAVSASFAQELDVNSGWKLSAGEPPLSWTSTFATVRVPAGEHLALQSGFDNRRNVRLWRDRDTPETDFVDRYRQGAWGGATFDVATHARGGAELRLGSGGDGSQTWTVNGEVYRATRWNGLLRGRWSRFTSPGSQSGLLSLAAGFDPLPQSHVEWSGGWNRTRDAATGFEDVERWLGVDVDLALSGRWYANGGFERQSAAAGGSQLFQAGLSVRF
jgi:hypothetical protein